jgi:O-antigen/teichoic acid export membrane protein
MISIVERAGAMLQTMILARLLGIADYGVYGLIFGTIGLTASLTGLQMGLTATVFLARFRESDKQKAAFVMDFTNRFGWGVSGLLLACTLPFCRPITSWLVGNATTPVSIALACLLIAFSILSGLQDGVLQGFEDFRSSAVARLATTLTTLALMYPACRYFRLPGVLATSLAALLVKYAILAMVVRRHARENAIPSRGSGMNAAELLWGFSVPAMLTSLFGGVVNWGCTLALSRMKSGFDAVAVINTGMQWRAPIILLTSLVNTVAIPAISRNAYNRDHKAVRALHNWTLLFNGGVALLVSAVVIAAAPFLLLAYGPEFAKGRTIFSLIVASSVPQVVAGIYTQYLVAKGLAWRQFFVMTCGALPMLAGGLLFIPKYGGLGFAFVSLAAATFAMLALIITHPGERAEAGATRPCAASPES